ncbi:MAG: hypothetical protein RBG1_1C00001G1231 [candidate division Zixibacteria bacterium RBG-1]|nr:MAG: hypothetical protein RBG1_1C00001G1231 [candidate division Zixibacteria bacterium RBG-1]OGC83234.1 MAG: hypothetical protein A2V73_05410 [candidate division Zixibacteria bacterium RBG_19FT_COMBO_42_43]
MVSILSCHSQYRYSDKKMQKIDACEILKNIDGNLDVIERNADKIILGNDNCVLDLLDSLTYKFVNNNEMKYIEALDSICQVADGYVGEAYWDIGREIFHKNFKGYFKYLYDHRSKNDCMEKRLIDGVSFEIHMAEDRENAKQEIDAFLRNKIIELKLTESEIEYLKKLQARFDPGMYD